MGLGPFPRAKVIQSPLVIVQLSLLREYKSESWQQRVAVQLNL